MLGSASVAAVVAQVAFWALLGVGVVSRELGARGTTIFIVLWACGTGVLEHLLNAELLMTPYLAVLDIALVLIIAKGDVRLS
ncbi:MAG: hypothetical protein QM736_14140 [Vicinamibacterales bacterium]